LPARRFPVEAKIFCFAFDVAVLGRTEACAKRRKTRSAGDLSSVAGRETLFFARKSDPIEARELKHWTSPGCISTASPAALLQRMMLLKEPCVRVSKILARLVMIPEVLTAMPLPDPHTLKLVTKKEKELALPTSLTESCKTTNSAQALQFPL
jgi:hypothetical protein